MDVNKHVCFRAEQEPMLISFLQENGIAYDQGEIITSFDILQSNQHWQDISRYIADRALFCISNTVFTESELSSAQWLTLRSQWRCGYPQPEAAFRYEQITYSKSGHCEVCGSGLIQNCEFRIKKTPKWGKRHFMMLNWVADELFLDDYAKCILEKEGLTGISFRQVLNSNGKTVLPDINQLVIPNTLPLGLVPEEPTVDQIVPCKACGCTKYHTCGIGMLKYKKEVFEGAPDVVKTSEIYGWGHSASRLIILNQKMYQTILKNKLDRGLVFEPLQLV